MTTLTSLEVKRQILAAKTSDIRSLNWEKALQYELNSFFQRLKEQVLHELEEYYPQDDEGVLLQGQLDLILAPIFESQQEYYNILRKFNIKEYNEGAKQGRRLVNLARKPLSSFKSEDTTNIKAKNLLNASIDKDELFGTSDWTQQKLLDHSFTASERTMNRVDQDINKLLSDGYASGAGIKPVANQIRKRFDQLRTWEARRIARTEIHNAHQMGIMNTYQEMGVEYTQWTAARDKRTRTSHRDIDGEIIPLGGTYSNGCQYPGDTNGPIEEWINCRCGNVPFIMPYGYMAPPGKAQFKESDLVQTLDYWNQDELISQINEKTSVIPKESSTNLDIINPKLIDSKFSIPTGDLSEFEITNKGMKSIQRYIKRRWGAEKEYGVVFDEKTGKFLTKEFRGNADDIVMLKPKSGKYSTIHYHTDEGFRPVSSGDLSDFLGSKNERVGINFSRKESWFIKKEHTFDDDVIDEIVRHVDGLEQKQLKKLREEYHEGLRKINKINDPVKRDFAKKEFEKKVANDLLDKHNRELGDAILEYTSQIKGLKIKRVIHTEIDPKSIKTLSKKELKLNKRSIDELLSHKKHSKQINGIKGKNSKHTLEINKNKKEKSNWNYEYKGKNEKLHGTYQIQGNTHRSRQEFQKEYGIDLIKLNKIENKKEKLFFQIFTKDAWPLNDYLRKGKINFEYYAKKWDKVNKSLIKDKILSENEVLSFKEAVDISEYIFEKYSVPLKKNSIFCRREKVRFMGKDGVTEYGDKGFTSTSIYEFAKVDKYGNEVNYILVPEDTPILYLEGITSEPEDYEVLFPPEVHLDHVKDISINKKMWIYPYLFI